MKSVSRCVRLGRVISLSSFVVALLVFDVASAQAAFLSYTDQATWEAAVAALGQSVTVEDFTDTTLQTGLTTTNGVIAGGVYDGLALTQFNDAGNPTISFSPGTLAVGGFFDLAPGGFGDGLVFVANGSTQLGVVTNPIPNTFSGFLGWVSTDATTITSLRMDSPGTGQEEFSLDNLEFATASNGGGNNGGGGTPVPEPSTLALLTFGLAGVLGPFRARAKSH